MKELVIISGKGGTGKTSIMGAFATLAKNKILCDADVDAADLHLIIKPTIRSRHEFKSGRSAIIDENMCSQCGQCRDLCQFEAISEDFQVDPVACEGCGVCVHFCPEKAIQFPINTCGEWYISDTRLGPMVHARLGIAEENSGKLVSLVRNEARTIAEKTGAQLILTDGPPGVGCPVIAAIGNADAVLVVTEPSVSGIHDLKRILALAEHFRVPAMICVNKYDLNEDLAADIHVYARESHATIMGQIPFDTAMTHAMVQTQTIVEYDPACQTSQAIQHIWEKVSAFVATQ
jgi:MinD superfamily P-loop ATPase